MTVVEAYSVFKKEHSDLVIVSCYEYDSFFAFHAVSSEYVDDNRSDMAFDSLFSVSKKDESISPFNPLDISEAEFNDGIKLPIEMFDRKIDDFPKYDRDMAVDWVNRLVIQQ